MVVPHIAIFQGRRIAWTVRVGMANTHPTPAKAAFNDRGVDRNGPPVGGGPLSTPWSCRVQMQAIWPGSRSARVRPSGARIPPSGPTPVSYTHLRAHETRHDL